MSRNEQFHAMLNGCRHARKIYGVLAELGRSGGRLDQLVEALEGQITVEALRPGTAASGCYGCQKKTVRGGVTPRTEIADRA